MAEVPIVKLYSASFPDDFSPSVTASVPEAAAFVSEVDKWLNELNYSGYIGKPCKFSSDYQWYDGRK